MYLRGSILRIIDANINRAKEGMRVCEDVMRLIINDKTKTSKLKKIRHDISKILKDSKVGECEIIKYRDSQSDVGKRIKTKNTKQNIYDILLANCQRVKEAIRVLEELFYIFDINASRKFQNLRFRFYNVEKECVKKLGHLCDIRYRKLP